QVVRVGEANETDVKILRKKGVRVNARAKQEMALKPEAKPKVKARMKEGAQRPNAPMKRKRVRDNGDEADKQGAAKAYAGAEAIDDRKTSAGGAAKRAKKFTPTDEYMEDCSARVDVRFKKQATSLERRIANGTVNENFVKANLRKKTYSRGLKKLNFKKYRFEQWKQAKQQSQKGQRGATGGADDEARMNKMQCFKCGGFGHWARYCFTNPRSTQEENADDDLEELHIPTLEEAAALARGIKNTASTSAFQQGPPITSTEACRPMPAVSLPRSVTASENKEIKDDSSGADTILRVDEDIDDVEEIMSQIPIEGEEANVAVDVNMKSNVQGEDTGFRTVGSLREIGALEVKKFLKELGFQDFRPRQETVVNRILKGQSTLLVSSTGSGKSLCYQLPAYIYATMMTCVTLVVSPLISLMEDQVTGLPGKLKAAYLHSGMTPLQRGKTLDLIKKGEIHVVLVSPEAVVAAGQGSSLLAGLPPIAFVCIDEAHCISEWSHNFRPSYLQLSRTVREKLGVQCVLALTATATKSTCADIVSHLRIDSHGVVGHFKLPDNLVFTASAEVDRDQALIDLLKSERFSTCSSIIVYTTRRDETERLAALIRTSMQDQLRSTEELATIKRQRAKARDVLRWDAEAYHAGLTSAKRKAVQNKFMKGQVRVVVATVAFGMGIDKADIRAIIHYNMPKSFENYVQEAGRAGRDGQRSDCHLFLEFKSADRNEIKRHIYADSTDRFVLRKFLEKMFEPMERLKDAMYVLTLMCFLESHPNKFVQLKQRAYKTATVKCYGGPSQFASLVKSSPILAAALALKKKFGELENEKTVTNTISFPVVEVATFMGWDSKMVKRDLKKLEWDDSRVALGGSYRKTGVMVEFSDLCFHLYVASDLGNLDQNEVLEYLYKRVCRQEQLQLERLAKVFSAFKHVALKPGEGTGEVDMSRSDTLKRIIENYFNEQQLGIDIDDDFNKESSEDVDEDFIRADIRSLVHSQPDQTFTGRAVARIMHGIASPNYPAQVWGRLRRVWRSHLEVDFPTLMRLANSEIVRWRSASGSQ
ncbi:ATP-dependent DNA helicase Q4-like, partial [Tropilaelaps mercedesae]